MKFKEWVDKVNNTKIKDWKITWKDILWFSWEWIWKFCTVCVLAVMGTYLFASLNDTLSNVKGGSVYGTWMWTLFAVMYFAVLLYAIYRVMSAKK